jgi:altronate hydrolase
MGHSFVRLHECDNVAIALRDLSVGDIIGDIAVKEPIAAGHKVSLSAVGLGENITKYATTIAVATKAIAPGQHVHVHNAGMPNAALPQNASSGAVDGALTNNHHGTSTFKGIRRNDGRVATRNYVGILTTVNCSATAARAMADHFRGNLGDECPGVDGVVALTHGYGCAMSPKSEGITTLRRTIAGYARHPNFAGVLVLGLGCESNELSAVLDEVGDATGITAFDIQSVGGTREAVSRGIDIVEGMLDRAKGVRREDLPLSHLSLGLQCGGSDAFSGISANPALGHAADLLVAAGGTVILSETPEIYGAEHLLADRAIEARVSDDLHHRVAWWRDHVAANGGTLNDNPSSGNIAGGITTILEKSLGAVAKAGTSPLTGVYEYAEPIDRPGLVFMDSPGFDPMSATGQVASGANLIAFTTGRGSTFGCKPVPSLKLATNTQIFERMRDDIDVNCGDIVGGSASIEEKGREIFEALIKMASGEPSASERLGFGEAEFAPWVPGAIT